MNKFRKQLSSAKGFTLVELLIVIALIAILSVAVLATINPIEQANKARDAAMQNDAAEILNGYERYYANSQKYPWMMFSDALSVGTSVILNSKTLGFGICYGAATGKSGDTGACNFTGTELGLLIDADELKASFAGKKPFQSDTEDDTLITYKQGGSGAGSIYVCYIPRAKSSRILTGKLKCISSTQGKMASTGETLGSGTCTAPSANDATKWSSATSALTTTDAVFRCVPESETAIPTATPTPIPG